MTTHPAEAYELLQYWLDNWTVDMRYGFERSLPPRFGIWVAYWEREGLLHRTPVLGLDRPQAELLLHLRQPVAPPEPAKAQKKAKTGATVEQRYAKDFLDDAWGMSKLSAQETADKYGCSKTMIIKSPTWKKLQDYLASSKIDREDR